MSMPARILGLIAAIAFAAIATRAAGQITCGGGGCAALLGPTRCSPLDLCLRPYYIPRTPAWGPHGYRYNVKEPEPCCCGGPGCGGCGGDSCPGTCQSACCCIPPEAAAAFDPYEFENLGQIPNDSMLGGVVAPQPR